MSQRRQAHPELSALMLKRMYEYADHGLADRRQLHVFYGGPDQETLARYVGFSPTINPVSGHHYGQDGFRPFWSSLVDHGHSFELSVEFGSGGFVSVLLIEDHEDVDPVLLRMCRHYAEDRFSVVCSDQAA